MVTIDIHNISKEYGEQIVLQNFSCQLQSGIQYGIQGHNGSGKSTLLKIIAGYVTANNGIIQYSNNGTIIPVENVYEKTSYLAPYLDIPKHLTFAELIEFHFSFRRYIQDFDIHRIYEYTGLPLHNPIRNFSSGMIQRVKLALAFFSESEILLLDEPTETLDKSGIQLYQELLEKYSKERLVVIASNNNRDFIGISKSFNITDYK